MSREVVYKPHSNYNTTHEAVDELMNKTCLCNKSLCNWFVHRVKLMLQSNVQMSIHKLLANLCKLLTNLSKLFQSTIAVGSVYVHIYINISNYIKYTLIIQSPA